MIYPRKRPVSEKMREGAYPNTIFRVSESGWINKELFLEWFKLFVQIIPPLRPVLLLMDGHGSHITIDVVEHARLNEIHLLCLPSHTSHILQPLDVGVFKSFKSFFSRVCCQYMSKNPGRVVTEEVLANLVGDAISQSHTPLNIFGGFKKAGIYPFNPGEVSDRELAPSKMGIKPTSQIQTFSSEQIAKFEKQYKEGYDVQDATYLEWKNIYHPSPKTSDSPTSVSVCGVLSTASSTVTSTSVVSVSSTSSPKSEDVLNELLVLPQQMPSKTGRRKKGINQKAKEITDPIVLQEMKEKEQADNDAKRKQKEQKLEREQKARERQEEKDRKKLEREKKAQAKQKEKEEKERKSKEKNAVAMPAQKQSWQRRGKYASAGCQDRSEFSAQQDIENQCFGCKMIFCQNDEVDQLWVCCDRCDKWYCSECHDMSEDSIPDEYYCVKCT
jgi:hypothetical protein